MKKFLSLLACLMIAFSMTIIPQADETVKAELYAKVEDNGQAIHKVVLDYGVEVSGVDVDTYTIHANTSSADVPKADGEMAFGDFNADRKIVSVKVDGTKVEILLDENDGAAGTLSYYLLGARNVPTTINYTVTQNKPVTTATGTIENPTIVVDNTVRDEEVSKFVAVDDVIDYQFYEAPEGDSLIVWFHGNGEGDYVLGDYATHNNMAQVLANRGTVAWATDEAQEIFGGAHVMSFQAPSHWYNSINNGLLEDAYNEIMDVVEKYGVDEEKIFVSGCSAGGFMSTRMIIAYPDLFAAAMINCPALDIANARAGEGITNATPTDEELKSILDSKTAIWLVQGTTDASVKPEDCSIRMFNILSEGAETIETRVDQEIQSGYTTTETKDGKYKLSLYDTTETGKLMFAEDFDQDGTATYTEFSNHWSWIYTLRNNPTDASGTNIWTWAAAQPTAGGSSNTLLYVGIAAVIAIGAFVVMKKKK